MTEPFYFPDPGLFDNSDAYRAFTRYAAELEAAGLRGRFPNDAGVRNIAIEVLAERYAVGDVQDDPRLIDEAVEEAEQIAKERQQGD